MKCKLEGLNLALRYNCASRFCLKLAPIDYVSLVIYFAFVLGIGWMAKRKITSSEDFLTSRHSVPVWITSLAFIAANLGAQEMIGMCASGAKYGDHDGPLLLAGRRARHGVCRRLHDAVLLRQPRTQRSGIPEAALR